MRPVTVLKILAAALLVVAVALIAAQKSVNTERYKTALAERIGAATGLNLIFYGPVKLRLGPTPLFAISGLGLARPGNPQPLLYIDRVEARIGLLPLLFRQFNVGQVALLRPVLRLDPETLPVAAGALGATAGFRLDQAEGGVPTTRFALSDVRVVDATVIWRPAPDRPDQRILVSQGRIRPESVEGGPLSLEAKGETGGTGFELSGLFGPTGWNMPNRPYPVQVKGTISGAVVVARGTIADPLTGQGLEIDLNARGDEVGDLVARAGLIEAGAPPPVIGPYRLTARLTGSVAEPKLDNIDAALGRRDTVLVSARGMIAHPLTGHGLDLAITAETDSSAGPARLLGFDPPGGVPMRLAGRVSDGPDGYRLSGLKATIGGGDLSGDVLFTRSPQPTLTGHLTATTLALADLGLEPGRWLTTAPTAARPAIPIVDERLLPADPLALDGLSALDLDLSVEIGRLPLGPARLSDVTGKIRLHSGRLAVESLSALVGDGRLTGEAVLDSSGRVPTVRLRLSGTGLDLSRVDGGFPFEGGSADLSLDLQAQGASPRLLAGNLDGHVVLGLNDAGLMATAAGGIPARLLTALDGGSADEDPLRLRCLALRLSAHGGMISAERGLAVETARAAILGSGTLDLRGETVDLILAARGGGAIRLRGGLIAPQIGGDGGPRPFSSRPPARPVVDATPCRAVLVRH